MKAYEVISSPEKWTKGTYARDSSGFPTGSRCSESVCWCAVGALTVAYGYSLNGVGDAYHEALFKVEHKLREMGKGGPHGYITTFNDHPDTTYEDVYNLLKELDV